MSGGARFERDDRVITPSGECARVTLVRDDGRLVLEYVGALAERDAQLELPARLCRKVVHGEREPRPVRLAPDGSVEGVQHG